MPHIEKRRPSECSIRQLAEFRRLVKAGGEVMSAGLDRRIQSAAWLAFAFDDHGTLVAVGALKRPGEGYRRSVFRKAACSMPPINYALELGWIFVDQERRGTGNARLLTQSLVELSGSEELYATTRTDNIAMKRTLIRFGFLECGSSYLSNTRDYELVLFVRSPPR
jgi:GNAT superfamily N-acetyltransferase